MSEHCYISFGCYTYLKGVYLECCYTVFLALLVIVLVKANIHEKPSYADWSQE